MGRGNQTFVPGSLPAGKRRKNGGDALRIKGRRLPGYYEDDGIRGRGDAMRSLKIPPCLVDPPARSTSVPISGLQLPRSVDCISRHHGSRRADAARQTTAFFSGALHFQVQAALPPQVMPVMAAQTLGVRRRARKFLRAVAT